MRLYEFVNAATAAGFGPDTAVIMQDEDGIMYVPTDIVSENGVMFVLLDQIDSLPD